MDGWIVGFFVLVLNGTCLIQRVFVSYSFYFFIFYLFFLILIYGFFRFGSVEELGKICISPFKSTAYVILIVDFA